MSRRRDVTFHTPLIAPALESIDQGRRPDERTLRGAIRELMHVRRWIVQRGTPGENGGILRWIDDTLDVLRWVREQPVDLQPRTCSACERRMARFGDLCGRCAESAGVRPRGKA